MSLLNNKSMFSVVLLISTLMLGACNGTSEVPVTYNAPNSSTVYTTSTFSPELHFPDGIPAKVDVEIRINGKDVTAEFDLWDSSSDDKARISGQVDNGSYPNILGVLRDGVNTFQVTKPSKQLIYFNMALAGAEVHVTEVVDSYCGTVFINNVGSSTDITDGSVTDFDCSRYFWNRCVHPSNIESSHFGITKYYSILGAECDQLKGGPAVPAYSLTKSGKSMYIRGYFENNEAMTSMQVNISTIATNGNWSNVGGTTVNVNHGASYSNGNHYAHFGRSGISCNGTTVNLDTNEFCMLIPDRDGVRITGTDSNGSGYTEWARSDIEQKDSRINNGGVLGIRGEVAALESILDVASASIATGSNLIAPPPAARTYVVNKDTQPSPIPGSNWTQIWLTSLSISKMNLNSDFPATPSGRLNLDIDLSCGSGGCSGASINGAGVIDYDCKGWFSGLVCRVLGIDGPFSFSANATTQAQVLISLNPSTYKMSTSTNLPNFNLSNLQVSVSGWLGGLVGFLTPFIANILQGFISDMIAGLIANLVDAIFNKDIPLMRIVVPSVDTDGNATKTYMSLRPELAQFTTNLNGYSEAGGTKVSGELAFGLHATGKPRINQSIGSIYDSGAPINLYPPRTARDNDPSTYSNRNVGFTLHESFVNQLFMGLWESGILYIDFNAGNNNLLNTFINNANVKFASASPWTIQHLANITLPNGTKENARGDVKIDINDLVLHITGDIYDPFRGVWYYDRVFFEFVIAAEIYANLEAESGALKINLETNPRFELLKFYSDYIPLNESLGNSILQQVTPLLVTQLKSITIPFPSVGGLNLDLGEVWVPDTTNLGLTLDASYTAP